MGKSAKVRQFLHIRTTKWSYTGVSKAYMPFLVFFCKFTLSLDYGFIHFSVLFHQSLAVILTTECVVEVLQNLLKWRFTLPTGAPL